MSSRIACGSYLHGQIINCWLNWLRITPRVSSRIVTTPRNSMIMKSALRIFEFVLIRFLHFHSYEKRTLHFLSHSSIWIKFEHGITADYFEAENLLYESNSFQEKFIFRSVCVCMCFSQRRKDMVVCLFDVRKSSTIRLSTTHEKRILPSIIVHNGDIDASVEGY